MCRPLRFNYFLSSFSGHDGYQESLNRFHEIFRPDGKHLASMRKVLDMDYELGNRISKSIKQYFFGISNKYRGLTTSSFKANHDGHSAAQNFQNLYLLMVFQNTLHQIGHHFLLFYLTSYDFRLSF